MSEGLIKQATDLFTEAFNKPKLNHSQFKPDIADPEKFTLFSKENKKKEGEQWGNLNTISFKYKKSQHELDMNIDFNPSMNLGLGSRNLGKMLDHLIELKRSGAADVSYDSRTQTFKIHVNTNKLVEELVKVPTDSVEKEKTNEKYSKLMDGVLKYRGGKYEKSIEQFKDDCLDTNKHNFSEEVTKNIVDYMELNLVNKFLKEGKLDEAFKARIADVNGSGEDKPKQNGETFHELSPIANKFYELYEKIDIAANIDGKNVMKNLIKKMEAETASEHKSPFAALIRDNLSPEILNKFKKSLTEHLDDKITSLNDKLNNEQKKVATQQIDKNYTEIENTLIGVTSHQNVKSGNVSKDRGASSRG